VNGVELQVGVEEMGEELVVEVCNQNHEVIATNSLHLADMWEVGFLHSLMTTARSLSSCLQSTVENARKRQ